MNVMHSTQKPEMHITITFIIFCCILRPFLEVFKGNILYLSKGSGDFYIIQGVTGGTDQTSGECSLGQTIPI